MLANSSSSKWGQLGWQKRSSSGHEIFIENNNGAGSNDWMHFAGKPIGSRTTYKITFDSTAKRLNYYVNGMLYAGLGAVAWTPASYQIFGETHNRLDQMPGGRNAHAKFLNTYYTASATWSPWFSLTTGVSHADTAGAVRVNSVDYEIWDLVCGS